MKGRGVGINNGVILLRNLLNRNIELGSDSFRNWSIGTMEYRSYEFNMMGCVLEIERS